MADDSVHHPLTELASGAGPEITDPTDYYDTLWQTDFEDMKTYGPFSRHCRRLIMDLVYPLSFRSVLDVGCGQGSLLAELCRVFPESKPHGLDVSALAIQLAQQRLPNGTFWKLDVARDRLCQKFDLVLCSEILEHIDDDLAALQNIRAMTRKYLLVSTVQGRMRQFERQIGHVRNYERGELVNKAIASGFRVTRVVEWGFPFYSPLYRDLLQFAGGKGSTGLYGPVRKAITGLLYHLFRLNSSKRGDEIFVLAEPASGGRCVTDGDS